MKFDALVKSEKNGLFRISDGKKIETDNLKVFDAESLASGKCPELNSFGEGQIFAVSVPFEKVDFGDGNYNEELLAGLREVLKPLEEKGVFCFILPESSKAVEDADQADSLIKAFVHAARRLKDCQSIVGFAIPEVMLEKDKGAELGEESWSRWFVNDMNVKHSHYVYFVNRAAADRLELCEKVEKTEFILY